jgi:hypothetical protein
VGQDLAGRDPAGDDAAAAVGDGDELVDEVSEAGAVEQGQVFDVDEQGCAR